MRRSMMTVGAGGGSSLPIPTDPPLFSTYVENPVTGTGSRYSLPLPVNTSADRMLMFVYATADAVQAGNAAPVGWTQLSLSSAPGGFGAAIVSCYTRIGDGATTANMGVMSGGVTNTSIVLLKGGAATSVSTAASVVDKVSSPVTLPKDGVIIPWGVRIDNFAFSPGSGWTYPYPDWQQFSGDVNTNYRLCYGQVGAGTITPALYGEAPIDMTYVGLFQINVGVWLT